MNAVAHSHLSRGGRVCGHSLKSTKTHWTTYTWHQFPYQGMLIVPPHLRKQRNSAHYKVLDCKKFAQRRTPTGQSCYMPGAPYGEATLQCKCLSRVDRGDLLKSGLKHANLKIITDGAIKFDTTQPVYGGRLHKRTWKQRICLSRR